MSKHNWRRKLERLIGQEDSQAAPQEQAAASTSHDDPIQEAGVLTDKASQSRRKKILKLALPAAKFTVNVTTEVADACPILKSVAAGLKVIIDHASVRESSYHRYLVSDINVGRLHRVTRPMRATSWSDLRG
jgi:uncharacterized membrane protein